MTEAIALCVALVITLKWQHSLFTSSHPVAIRVQTIAIDAASAVIRRARRNG